MNIQGLSRKASNAFSLPLERRKSECQESIRLNCGLVPSRNASYHMHRLPVRYAKFDSSLTCTEEKKRPHRECKDDGPLLRRNCVRFCVLSKACSLLDVVGVCVCVATEGVWCIYCRPSGGRGKAIDANNTSWIYGIWPCQRCGTSCFQGKTVRWSHVCTSQHYHYVRGAYSTMILSSDDSEAFFLFEARRCFRPASVNTWASSTMKHSGSYPCPGGGKG